MPHVRRLPPSSTSVPNRRPLTGSPGLLQQALPSPPLTGTWAPVTWAPLEERRGPLIVSEAKDGSWLPP